MIYYQAKIPDNWYGKRGKNETGRALRAKRFSDGKYLVALANLAKWNVSGIFVPPYGVPRQRGFA
jgi:hypothetical protein